MPRKNAEAFDRLPIICAAGIPAMRSESIGNLLRVYPKEDLAEIIVKSKKGLSEFGPAFRTAPIIPDNNQLKDILAPDLNKSRFLEFKDQFYENLYCKKVPLGKPTPANSKPDHINNENVTFGIINEKAESVYGLVLPKKSPIEVLREHFKWHDKYRFSHGDYFPSERIQRRYSDAFDSQKVFGEKHNVDTSGVKVKNIIENFSNCSKFNIINKTQEDFVKHHKSALGKPLKKISEIKELNTIYGRSSTPDEYNVRQLLHSTVAPEKIREFANTTTYRAFATDLNYSELECRNPAGSFESKYPRKGECTFLAENLGEETSAKQLISPSIPTQFGLSHRDFLVPRTKEQIKRIFTNAGFDLKKEEFFEKVWTAALAEWTSIGDRVSIEAFKYALHTIENESK